MRIALISDLHANLVALDAVLADAERVGVDRVICLGDIADLGPEPKETLERLRERGIPCIVGNHDPFPAAAGPERYVAWVDWARACLTDDDAGWLRDLPATIPVELAPGVELLCVHGSPVHFEHQVCADTPEAELSAWLAGVTSPVVACGHTHVQVLRRLGAQTLVNVGSVGAPFDRIFDGRPPAILPWAEYGIVSFDRGLSVDLRRVAYDVGELFDRARRSGMPFAEAWIRQWVSAP